MANTSSRSLRLLSLLQRRRFWPGPELADRLEVSERTLRRDIDRLRSLGYPIDAVRGVEGGYRFEAGAALPPLQFDADEAVALTVALHTAAGSATGLTGESGLAEAAAGALAKIIPVLPPELRARAEALRSVTDIGARGFARGAASTSMSVLGIVAQACRDSVRLAFRYDPASNSPTDRYVEPYRLVAIGQRWYLVAFDPDRDDWRTFRLDRMSDPRPARTPFTSRPLPDEDLHRYVSERIRALTLVYRIVADVRSPAEAVRATIGNWVTTESTATGCRVTFEADRLDWPLVVLAGLDAPLTIVGPPELVERATLLAARLSAAIPSIAR
jgi:predicted DNA-binding transcriptional regulator YafY